MKIFRICFVLFFAAALFGNSYYADAATKKVTKPAVVKKAVKKAAPKPVPPKRVAQLLIATASDLRLAPGEAVSVRFGFKNVGKLGWKNREVRLVGADGQLFATDTWASSTVPVKLSGTELKVGRLEFIDINLKAPDQAGSYVFKASIIADGETVSGGSIVLPIEVVNAESQTIVSDQLIPEPRIRVALGKTEGPLSVRISKGNYSVNLLDGTPVGLLVEGEKFLLQYDPTQSYYSYTFNGVITTSTQPFRVLGDSPDSRFVLTDKNDVAKWNKKIVYNEYRDTFELRWSDKIPGAWMINELPIEHYLKGLVETGNSEPYELQKAVYTAARTYAYIYLPTDSSPRTWDVHSVWDQVYKGYSAEVTNPNGARAVEETRGVLVTYEHKPVVTPYFTRSDGMTRGWKAVWGGKDKPWLQPVSAVYDAGKKMWGHGVGMSTLDAKARVQKDGWNYSQVLTYYYTGVLLQKVYQ
jgi:hypothetical protein